VIDAHDPAIEDEEAEVAAARATEIAAGAGLDLAIDIAAGVEAAAETVATVAATVAVDRAATIVEGDR